MTKLKTIRYFFAVLFVASLISYLVLNRIDSNIEKSIIDHQKIEQKASADLLPKYRVVNELITDFMEFAHNNIT